VLRLTVVWALLFAFRAGAQPAGTGPAGPRARLGSVIAKTQRAHIRESYGELAGECFTWVDLDRFRRAGAARVLAAGLRSAPEVREVVVHFQGRSIDEVRASLGPLRKALRPTWAQLGKISRHGQTEAGNRAERELADAIVDMVLGLLSAPSK
jgi:hypothetical protein